MKLRMQLKTISITAKEIYLFAESSKYVYPGSKDVKYLLSEQKL